MGAVSYEDVLAAALLWWLTDKEGATSEFLLERGGVPAAVYEVMCERYVALDCPLDLAVLVRDCERRWEVERAEQDVVGAAWWASRASTKAERSAATETLDDAVARLERARADAK